MILIGGLSCWSSLQNKNYYEEPAKESHKITLLQKQSGCQDVLSVSCRFGTYVCTSAALLDQVLEMQLKQTFQLPRHAIRSMLALVPCRSSTSWCSPKAWYFGRKYQYSAIKISLHVISFLRGKKISLKFAFIWAPWKAELPSQYLQALKTEH